MTRAETIAEDLADKTDLGAAAVLVAMVADPDLVLTGEEEYLGDQLEDEGCLSAGRVTALGRDVAKELRRKGILAGTEE